MLVTLGAFTEGKVFTGVSLLLERPSCVIVVYVMSLPEEPPKLLSSDVLHYNNKQSALNINE